MTATRPDAGVPPLAAGHGRLHVARVGAASAIVACAATNPLKLLGQRHGEAVWAYQATFGAGLMPGDDLRLAIEVGAQARALLTTQAQTKVLPCGDGVARSRIDARVGAAAAFVLWGDPLACFADARYAAQVAVELDADADALVVDAVTAGRCARGERWSFARYASRVTITRAGRPLAIDALLLDRDDGDIAARLRGCSAFATAILSGQRVAPIAARALAQVEARDVHGRPRVAASPIADGCVVRVAADGAEQATATLRALVGDALALVGGDPWSRRG